MQELPGQKKPCLLPLSPDHSFLSRRAQMLERQGSFHLAGRAYFASGQDEGVKRVQKNLELIKDARLMLGAHLYHRAARLLMATGLEDRSDAFSRKLRRSREPLGHYARLMIESVSGRRTNLPHILGKLGESGPFGTYLCGLAILDVDPRFATHLARSLYDLDPGQVSTRVSGKAVKPDAEAALRAAIMPIVASQYSRSQLLFMASRVFQMSDDDRSASNCLLELYSRRNINLLSFVCYAGACLSRGMHKLLSESLKKAAEGNDFAPYDLAMVQAIMDDDPDALIAAAREAPNPRIRFKRLNDIISGERGAAFPLSECISDASMSKLIQALEFAKKEFAAPELTKIARAKSFLRGSPSPRNIKKARELLETIDSRALNYGGKAAKAQLAGASKMLAVATLASDSSDSASLSRAGEALVVAKEYGQAFSCAQKLLERKEFGLAAGLLHTIATSKEISDEMRSDLLSLGLRLEDKEPRLVMKIYSAIGAFEHLKRIGQAIIAGDEFDAIRDFTWELADLPSERNTPLMRSALIKLRSMDPEGLNLANLVISEHKMSQLILVP